MVISRKMPIHARMSVVFADIVSLLHGLQTSNDPHHQTVVQNAFDRAQTIMNGYFAERFDHPWDYCTVSFSFVLGSVTPTDFHNPLQFYGVQRQGFGPLLHTVSQQVGFSNFCWNLCLTMLFFV